MERRADDDRLPVEHDRPAVRPLDAGEDLDEGRLAGSVLTDEGVDLTPGDGEVDVLEGVDARKGLVDTFHDDDVAGGQGHDEPRSSTDRSAA